MTQLNLSLCLILFQIILINAFLWANGLVTGALDTGEGYVA